MTEMPKFEKNKKILKFTKFLHSLEMVFVLCKTELMCKLGDGNIFRISCDAANIELT